jgi:dTMP kinase
MGTFIVIDGIDGSSKTTQVRLLTEALRKSGERVIPTFEPTNHTVGVLLQEEVRKSDQWRMPARALTHLFVVDRLMHLRDVIRPALKDGVTVICDRYYYSTMVHQGIEMSPDPQDFWRAANFVEALHRGFRKPDITFLLDVPVPLALHRIAQRKHAPQSTERVEHLERARRHYLQLATALPDNILPVDATGTPEATHQKILTALNHFRAMLT